MGELERAAAAIRNSLIPCPRQLTVTYLTRMSVSLRMEEMPSDAWKMHLEDYAEDLAEYPEDIISEGCKNWRRREKFWPVIADFLSIVRPKLDQRRRWLKRIEVMLRVVENPSLDERHATEEWLDAVFGRPKRTNRSGVRPFGEIIRGINRDG